MSAEAGLADSGLTAARGDVELAERLVAELGVSPSAGGAIDAGWGSYLSHLIARLTRAFTRLLFRAVEAVPLPAGWPRILAVVVAAAALVLVALVAVRAVRNRRKKRREAQTGSPEVMAAPAGDAQDEEARDAAAWRAELEALLAADRHAEALRALWWWLARALAGEGADPSWTGRELLERSGRRDLLPVVRRLETFTYGQRRPAAADLRAVARELEGALT